MEKFSPGGIPKPEEFTKNVCAYNQKIYGFEEIKFQTDETELKKIAQKYKDNIDQKLANKDELEQLIKERKNFVPLFPLFNENDGKTKDKDKKKEDDKPECVEVKYGEKPKEDSFFTGCSTGGKDKKSNKDATDLESSVGLTLDEVL